MAVQYSLTSASWPAAGVTGAVTAVITAPTGGEATQTLAATTASTNGQPTVWFTPQTVGSYTIVWASTGGQTGTSSVQVDGAPEAVSVMSLADCYASLKMPLGLIGADSTRDADMLAYARAAVGAVEMIVGPVAPATVTQIFDGGRDSLLLRARPRSIVAVTAAGQPVTGWSCDFAAGILRSGNGWPAGTRNIEVRYTVGSTRVAPNVLLGIREVFRQLWERSRALGGQASSEMVMQGFAIPNATRELLAGTSAYPGFA